jgi:hypothetical protein
MFFLLADYSSRFPDRTSPWIGIFCGKASRFLSPLPGSAL